jgi:hypothetical protein
MLVEFYFYAFCMESGEDFWVQYYNGSSWQTAASFARGVDFNNNTYYHVVLQIPKGTYTYPTNARLRFMCDASDNNDDVYIDAIEWRGWTGGSSNEGFATSPAAPKVFSLSQNYPNPFNPTTTIAFNLPEAMHVKLDVFNVAGERVATLVDEVRGEGPQTVIFDAAGLSSGIYFYRIIAGDFKETRKMMLLK